MTKIAISIIERISPFKVLLIQTNASNGAATIKTLLSKEFCSVVRSRNKLTIVERIIMYPIICFSLRGHSRIGKYKK